MPPKKYQFYKIGTYNFALIMQGTHAHARRGNGSHFFHNEFTLINPYVHLQFGYKSSCNCTQGYSTLILCILDPQILNFPMILSINFIQGPSTFDNRQFSPQVSIFCTLSHFPLLLHSSPSICGFLPTNIIFI